MSLLNVDECPQVTRDNFEITASYIANVLYNDLYVEAKKFKVDGRAASVTEGYKLALSIFAGSVKSSKFSGRVLHGIHDQFQKFGFSSMPFGSCISRLASDFIPSDYASHVELSKKKQIVVSALSEATHRMIQKIARTYISMIIDNHSDKKNGIIMLDAFKEELMIERNNKFRMFLDQNVSAKARNSNTPLIQRMQQEIAKLVSEKVKISQQNKALMQIVKKQAAELEVLRKHAAELASIKKKVAKNMESRRHEEQRLLESLKAERAAASAISPADLPSAATPAPPPTQSTATMAPAQNTATMAPAQNTATMVPRAHVAHQQKIIELPARREAASPQPSAPHMNVASARSVTPPNVASARSVTFQEPAAAVKQPAQPNPEEIMPPKPAVISVEEDPGEDDNKGEVELVEAFSDDDMGEFDLSAFTN